VQRDNIILDGGGHDIQRVGGMFPKGVGLYGIKNVTVQNLVIKALYYGVEMNSAMSVRILGCNISECTWAGVFVGYSSNINMIGNNFSHNGVGVILSSSSNNSIKANTFVGDGLYVFDSYSNKVFDNIVNGKPLVYLEKTSDFSIANAGQVVLIDCNNISVQDLNLSYTTVGVQLTKTNNSKIVNNTIANGAIGIWVYNASGNTVIGNVVTNNSIYGIYLGLALHNNVTGNAVTGSVEGIILDWSSSYNRIVGNTVKHNTQYGISVYGSSNNLVYHNNFVDNAQQAYSASSGYANTWDDGYPSGGNFWSNYGGADTNHDGLGDTVHQTDTGNIDNHPLMGMFNTFNAGTWDGTLYYVDVVSNSSLANFVFNPDNHTLTFDVEGTSSTNGFCRVTVPKGLMWCDNPNDWVVKVGGTLIGDRTTTEHDGYTYIYFAYTHSTKKVEIKSTGAVPEFVQTMLLIIFAAATTVLLIAKKSKKPKTST
jgi:parallel beta-helix repeat protein